MSLRKHLDGLFDGNHSVKVSEPISKTYEITAVLKELEPTPVLLENVQESEFRVIGNLFCTKGSIAEYLGVPIGEVIPRLAHAIDHRTPCKVVEQGLCQDVVQTQPDLDQLPILKHFTNDGGNYITSGVVIAKHPTYGINLDFHRCMQISRSEMALRVVETRHFDTFLKDMGEMDIAVCIGNPPGILLAAATSVEIGVNELEIANALESITLVQAKSVDLLVPAEAEFILEGTIYFNRSHPEGPFVDLTETEDVLRLQPVFVVKTITHRRDALWHALLPGGMEHRLLMGMPREPTIYKMVSQVTRCLDVNVSRGGCSWLHAIVQIDKQTEQDGIKAIQAAFEGHRSCKHVYVVDKDIDIYNPYEVEWAMATRFQGDRQMVIKEKERGSSLDPSAEADTHLTTKIGFDLTKPLSKKGKAFEKVKYPEVEISRFIKDKS